jgi:putative protease
MDGIKIGTVTHFYNRLCVAVIELSDSIQVGDDVHFLGRLTDFRQKVKSIQIEHEQVEGAEKGTEIALKVDMRVRKGDKVFKLTEAQG